MYFYMRLKRKYRICMNISKKKSNMNIFIIVTFVLKIKFEYL